MTNLSATSTPSISLRGEVTRTPSHTVVLALLTFSGLLLMRGVLKLVFRYCLGLKNTADATIGSGGIQIETTWTFFGKEIRHQKTVSPISAVRAVRLENRQRYLYLVVGFSALVVGALIGIQWFLDGLHAGYPYLTALGALIATTGAAIDIVLYLFVPRGKGRSHLVFAAGPWIVRFSGVEPERAEEAMSLIQTVWKDR